jgi:hypothetical protein
VSPSFSATGLCQLVPAISEKDEKSYVSDQFLSSNDLLLLRGRPSFSPCFGVQICLQWCGGIAWWILKSRGVVFDMILPLLVSWSKPPCIRAAVVRLRRQPAYNLADWVRHKRSFYCSTEYILLLVLYLCLYPGCGATANFPLDYT